jgi:hypothetical protein
MEDRPPGTLLLINCQTANANGFNVAVNVCVIPILHKFEEHFAQARSGDTAMNINVCYDIGSACTGKTEIS